MYSKEVKVGIAGMGFYFPETTVSTKEIADEINLPEKVHQNIGIKKIFKPSEDDHPTKMAYLSAMNALKDAETFAIEIDLIVVAVFRNDYLHWQMGGWLKEKLGAENAMTVEVKGGCAAHFQAVELAVDQIKGSSDIHTVLVICAERLFGYGWPSFLSSGGQAIVIKRGCEQFNYLDFGISNYIIHHEMASIPNGGILNPFTPETDWKEGSIVENVVPNEGVYSEYVKPVVFDKFSEVTNQVLEKAGYQIKDVDYMVTLVQQGNFDERILKTLKIPELPSGHEFKADLGHFSGADPYILLDQARKSGKIKKGDLILKLGFGGVAWFASLIRY